jgi:hypothetical protein
MKRLILVTAIGAVLTGCGTTDIYEKRAEAARERQERAVDRVLDQAPKWMAELPKSKDAVYASGTAASGDYNMALGVARTNAFEGICMAAGGEVKSQTKVFRTDTERTSTQLNTTAIKSMCPSVDITGAEVKDSKMIREGTRFRAYVLVALPMGEANTLATTKEANRQARRAVGQRDAEFRELDTLKAKSE